MALHDHHQPRVKSFPLQFVKASQFRRETKRYHLFRGTFLLFLMLYTGYSVLRLATLSPSCSSSVKNSYFSVLRLTTLSPSHSSLVQPVKDSFFEEKSRDVESLKTHISSTKNHLQAHEEKGSETLPSCSDLVDGVASSRLTNANILCCDRSHQRTDVCYMKGDIRTDVQSSSILLHKTEDVNNTIESVRPYTRKWESLIMSTVDEIKLRPMPVLKNQCDVHHNVTAIVFSTGGYTGNVYHEFNDGLIPLYITAERFKGEVVFVVLEYHSWWKTKYKSIVKKLSNYQMVDFSGDRRVHCFTEMIVGLKIHGELTVDPKLMHDGKGIQDFQTLLDQGFGTPVPATTLLAPAQRPKLAIFIRNRSRVLQKLKEIIKICEKTGFDVQILNPKRTTPLSEIHRVLYSSDAMLAVHGAAMAHFLFLRPGKVLIQIVPLGLDWAAEEYYGEPARKLGLHYIAYKMKPEESSLYRQYDHRNPVIRDPNVITSKGWLATKRIYLDRQNVRIDHRKFSRLIAKVHSDIVHRLQGRM